MHAVFLLTQSLKISLMWLECAVSKGLFNLLLFFLLPAARDLRHMTHSGFVSRRRIKFPRLGFCGWIIVHVSSKNISPTEILFAKTTALYVVVVSDLKIKKNKQIVSSVLDLYLYFAFCPLSSLSPPGHLQKYPPTWVAWIWIGLNCILQRTWVFSCVLRYSSFYVYTTKSFIHLRTKLHPEERWRLLLKYRLWNFSCCCFMFCFLWKITKLMLLLV